jgi:hypothetical protein
MTSSSKEEKTLSENQTDFILEKQFQSYEKIQNSLFKSIRFIGLGITGVAGVVSFILSIASSSNSFIENIENSISTYSQLPYTTEVVVLSVFISSIIGLVIACSIVSNFVKIIYEVLIGLNSPTLEPIESYNQVSKNVDELNNKIAWIKENHKSIKKSSEALDSVYEMILLASFKLLLLFFVSITTYSADLQLIGITLGSLIILFWPYMDRPDEELLDKDFKFYHGRYSIRSYTNIGALLLLIFSFYYELILEIVQFL